MGNDTWLESFTNLSVRLTSNGLIGRRYTQRYRRASSQRVLFHTSVRRATYGPGEKRIRLNHSPCTESRTSIDNLRLYDGAVGSEVLARAWLRPDSDYAARPSGSQRTVSRGARRDKPAPAPPAAMGCHGLP